jgi:hypothetical protein
MSDFVPESAIDYAEAARRGADTYGDEDFALFKCPACGHVYLIDYEIEMIYPDPDDLSRRVAARITGAFDCVTCGNPFRGGEAIIGPKADPKFCVTWPELARSGWSWIARQRDGR